MCQALHKKNTKLLTRANPFSYLVYDNSLGDMKSLKAYVDFTEKEKALVDNYTDPDSPSYRNQVQSYVDAGYYIAKVPEGQEDDGRARKTAIRTASKYFAKPHIKAEVERRFDEELKALEMSVTKVVAKISQMADVNLMDYVVEVPTVCPHCEGDIHHGTEHTFDIEKMKADGYGYLLAGMTPTKQGTKFSFYKADQMLDRLMRYHGVDHKRDSGSNGNTFYIDKMVQLAQNE